MVIPPDPLGGRSDPLPHLSPAQEASTSRPGHRSSAHRPQFWTHWPSWFCHCWSSSLKWRIYLSTLASVVSNFTTRFMLISPVLSSCSHNFLILVKILSQLISASTCGTRLNHILRLHPTYHLGIKTGRAFLVKTHVLHHNCHLYSFRLWSVLYSFADNGRVFFV